MLFAVYKIYLFKYLSSVTGNWYSPYPDCFTFPIFYPSKGVIQAKFYSKSENKVNFVKK